MTLETKEKIVMHTHCSHCGGTCMLKVHVKEGVITRIETDDGEEPQNRACARGRASRQRVYAPDRILYPLKRTGERGAGDFKRISWDEAMNTVASELTRVRKTYGADSVLFKASGGDMGRLQGRFPHLRLLRMSGGCSEVWGNHSYEGALFAQNATFGTLGTTSTRDNWLHSKLIILWGCNPADTVLLTNTMWFLLQAREKGAKIVSVDPRYSRTAAGCASQWIPIRPGTDVAMMAAMTYVILSENLQDQKFIDTYTYGFDKYRDYVMGVEDGVPKTPKWAEDITGVSASTMETLAREYATTKPAALMAGIAAGRTAYGEQFHRAGAALAAMTGNTGKLGGDAGISAYTGIRGIYPYLKLAGAMPMPTNPVQAPPRKNSFQSWESHLSPRTGSVHLTKTADALLKGKAGGYPADFKLLYIVNNNYPNQYFDLNKCVAGMKVKSLEFVVAFEQFMTSAAKYADIVIPVSTDMETNDITTGPTTGFYGFMGKAIESVGESKSHFEICIDLAKRLGVEHYSDKTEDEWLRQMAAGSPDIKDYEKFKREGGLKIKLKEPYVAFKKEIEDPMNNPFPTPSGKIEIFSSKMAQMNDPMLPPIPKYIETWESRNDPLAKEYPLQMVTCHFWRRAHSQYDNIPWLRELERQQVEINPVDASVRGIKNGDMVKVFNGRGITMLPAKVTEIIMPGVVNVPEGAWYDPDKNGVDRAGTPNVLTKDQHSPGWSYPTNTCLVQIEKI